MASVIRRWGRRAKNWSLTGAENSAADDTTATSDDRSWSVPGSASDSIRGLPIASPVIMTVFTRSSPTSRQTWWGSNLAIEHDLGADEALAHHAPLGRPVHERGDRQVHHRTAGTLGDHDRRVLHPLVRHRVGAAAECVEHVLVAPHDALGHAGGPAGVEDVEVVSRAGPEVTFRRLARQRLLVADGPGRRLGVAAVLDHDHVPEAGELGAERGDQRRELPLVDERLEVGVGQQVAQLVLDVAVVDVDPDRPQLEDGPRRLDPLDRVVGVDPDVIPRTDPLRGQVVGQPVRPGLHLGIGAPLPVGHEVLPLGVGVDGRLEQVGEVELHRPQVRTRSRSAGDCRATTSHRPRPPRAARSGRISRRARARCARSRPTWVGTRTIPPRARPSGRACSGHPRGRSAGPSRPPRPAAGPGRNAPW